MSTYDLLKQLVGTFSRDVESARRINSTNLANDEFVKIAIIGFSYESAPENWGYNHLNFLKKKLSDNYGPDALEFFEEDGPIVARFVSLCYGYLLGLYQAGKIDDQSFAQTELLLPGLIEVSLSHLR